MNERMIGIRRPHVPVWVRAHAEDMLTVMEDEQAEHGLIIVYYHLFDHQGVCLGF